MPELPEVETVVRALTKNLIGSKVESVKIVGHHIFRGKTVNYDHDVVGKTISQVCRYGKYILISFSSSPKNLQIHLGMTGQLWWVPKKSPLLNHTHLIFKFETMDEELRYVDIRRFGWFEMVEGQLGNFSVPDAWRATDSELLTALKSNKGYIKNMLLGQQVMAGLGNIYVDESLHRAKIHPRERLEEVSLPKKRKLVQSIRSVLKESISLGGTSVQNYVDIFGGRGGFKERLKVYGKKGVPCSCKKKIVKTVVAGRGTYYCPRCQRQPTKTL